MKYLLLYTVFILFLFCCSYHVIASAYRMQYVYFIYLPAKIFLIVIKKILSEIGYGKDNHQEPVIETFLICITEDYFTESSLRTGTCYHILLCHMVRIVITCILTTDLLNMFAQLQI